MESANAKYEIVQLMSESKSKNSNFVPLLSSRLALAMIYPSPATKLIGRRFARVIFFFANSNFVHKGIKHVYPKSDFLTLKQKILQKKAEHIAVQYFCYLVGQLINKGYNTKIILEMGVF